MASASTLVFLLKLSRFMFRRYKALNIPQNGLHTMWHPGFQNTGVAIARPVLKILLLFFISLRDIKTSLTYVTDYVTDYVPSFSTSNFGALLLYEREGWVQINVNRYWTPGQVWVTQIEIKLLAYVSPEKIAFPWEVFLKFCLILLYHTFCISPSFEGNTYLC